MIVAAMCYDDEGKKGSSMMLARWMAAMFFGFWLLALSFWTKPRRPSADCFAFLICVQSAFICG